MNLLILLLITAVGGVSVPIAKFALTSFSPIGYVSSRALLVFLLILPFTFSRLNLKAGIQDKKLLLVTSLFAANWVFFALGLNLTSVFMSILIYIPTSLVVAIIARGLFGEKLNKYQIVGLLFAIGGMSLVAYGQVTNNGNFSFGSPLGNLIILCAQICWSFYVVLSSRLTKGYSPVVLMTYNFLATFLISLIFLPFDLVLFKTFAHDVTLNTMGALVFIAIFPSLLFFLLYQILINHASPILASMALYPPNILGILISILILKEQIPPTVILGTLFVLLGIFIASTFEHAKRYIRKS